LFLFNASRASKRKTKIEKEDFKKANGFKRSRFKRKRWDAFNISITYEKPVMFDVVDAIGHSKEQVVIWRVKSEVTLRVMERLPWNINQIWNTVGYGKRATNETQLFRPILLTPLLPKGPYYHGPAWSSMQCYGRTTASGAATRYVSMVSTACMMLIFYTHTNRNIHTECIDIPCQHGNAHSLYTGRTYR
jgi:hypothetical protein